jgi:midasin (ATPase involved in ribosome maturation)
MVLSKSLLLILKNNIALKVWDCHRPSERVRMSRLVEYETIKKVNDRAELRRNGSSKRNGP